jgi:hypothetical protein
MKHRSCLELTFRESKQPVPAPKFTDANEQLAALVCQSGGEFFSLSQRERAGVREQTLHAAAASCSRFRYGMIKVSPAPTSSPPSLQPSTTPSAP